ncbi:MAG: spermidine/putrescine ABC transporter substrate-binding protein [unclassified Hahellaceae]|nr:spermidine/putrescine ABC transporter substrate-binding protein [Hahellaceae bacterium]|tara:strand:- start:81698 stop:82780 length:1083 start_codon:yes stop_codon:yes gene_type:complete
MKRLLQSCVLSAATLLAAALLAVNIRAQELPSELVLLTWSHYFDPAVIAEFERANNTRIRLINFETDDGRDELLLETDGRGFDLIVANGTGVGKYAREGWLAPIEDRLVPNRELIAPQWFDYFPEAREYAVPYTWGTVGIAYRKDLYRKPVESWAALFKPDPALFGKIAMIRSSRDTVGMALKMLGYSMNSESIEEINAVAPLLVAQRPFVKAYSYPVIDAQSALVSGEIVMTMIYSGDALTLQQHHPDIQFVLPREGTGLWVDYLVLSTYSREKTLAYRFLNFINEPAVAARLMSYVNYASPNAAAEKLLPESILNNPVVYPPPEVLLEAERFTRLSPKAARLRKQLFANVAERTVAPD